MSDQWARFVDDSIQDLNVLLDQLSESFHVDVFMPETGWVSICHGLPCRRADNLVKAIRKAGGRAVLCIDG